MISFLNLEIDTSFLYKEVYNEKVVNYLWFLGIITATLLLKRAIANLLTWFSSRFAPKLGNAHHKKEIKDLLFKPVERLLEIVLFIIAFNRISDFLDSIDVYHSISKKGQMVIKLGDVVEHTFLLLFIIFLTQVITRVVDFVYYINYNKANEEKNNSKLQLLPLIKELSKLLIWAMGIFWIMGSVFHVNVPALITGLGIGGVAIALAGKETVENFFAAFTIISDKPFLVGDYIKLGEIEGTAERIGFRSTRIRAIDGASIIIPNQKLVSQNLINLTARATQGVKMVFNIRYGITEDKLKELCFELKQKLTEIEYVIKPVDIIIEIFNVETFQLIIKYHLPNPLPGGMDYYIKKNEIGVMLYGTICKYTMLGSSIITNNN